MNMILKLEEHNEKKEIGFELDYLVTLSKKERFRMMIDKSNEIKKPYYVMDTESRLKLLNDNGVDFVIIGATAFSGSRVGAVHA